MADYIFISKQPDPGGAIKVVYQVFLNSSSKQSIDFLFYSKTGDGMFTPVIR